MKILNALLLITILSSSTLLGQFDLLGQDSIEIKYDGNYGLTIVKNILNEKYGVIDNKGNIISNFIYDRVLPFHDELAMVFLETKVGFINRQGDIAIPLDYTSGNHFVNGKAVMTDNSFAGGVINKSNEIIIPFKYNALQTHDHTTYHFQLAPKQSGLMDANEKIIIEPNYHVLIGKNDSLWVGMKKNEDDYFDHKFTILKNDGSLHNLSIFDEIGSLNKAGLMRFEINEQVGFLDEHFKTVIPAQYDDSGPSMINLVSVKKDGKWGFLNKENKAVTGFDFDNVKSLNDENVIVTVDGKYNILDKDANFRLDFESSSIKSIYGTDLIFMKGHIYDINLERKTESKINLGKSTFGSSVEMENGMMKIYSNGKLGYIDTSGSVKIEPNYEDGFQFYEGKCTAVKQGGKWGFINNKNKLLTPFEFDTIIHFGAYGACNFIVSKNGLQGCFLGDTLIVEPQFEEIIAGQDNSLVFRMGNQYGIIGNNRTDQEYEFYDSITGHSLGYEVRRSDKFGLLDKNLNLIIPIEYDTLQHAGFYIIAKQNGKYGTINESNEVISGFIYDKIEVRPLDFMVVILKGDKVGVLGTDGAELLPPIYDQIEKLDWKNVQVTLSSEVKILNLVSIESKKNTKGNK